VGTDDLSNEQSPSSSILIRFTPKQPSILEFPDNPEALDVLVDDLLRPRETDRGWLSCWEADCPKSENNIIAGYTAKYQTRKPKKLIMLRIPKSIIEGSGIEMRPDLDDKIFACISDLHRLVKLDSKAIRLKLAMEILRIINSNEDGIRIVFSRKKKGEIAPFIKSVYEMCSANGLSVELVKVQQWVKDEVKIPED
jgi:hypothetical protein